MIQSMTGFGRSEGKLDSFGIATVEIRSINHKFLEAVIHLPEGFLSLEDKIKKEIESRVQRGRVTCVINIVQQVSRDVMIDEDLVKKYVGVLKGLSRKYGLKDELTINSVISLPGVLALSENKIPTQRMWPQLKLLLTQALDDLVSMRAKEGKALALFLKARNATLKKELDEIKERFKKVVKEKANKFATDMERTAFLKESDITEEIERLDYHIKNFQSKWAVNAPLGKELDFIAQEMQREANTMGAKSCDTDISGKVVFIKSQIEKTREQLQNIV
ncbi:MAG TPA: YicC family protein [Candidatus Omnitrophota bacterium]|nr:YicC family protein [Candidatus Omnitrophota bacterium]